PATPVAPVRLISAGGADRGRAQIPATPSRASAAAVRPGASQESGSAARSRAAPAASFADREHALQNSPVAAAARADRAPPARAGARSPAAATARQPSTGARGTPTAATVAALEVRAARVGTARRPHFARARGAVKVKRKPLGTGNQSADHA